MINVNLEKYILPTLLENTNDLGDVNINKYNTTDYIYIDLV